jgi:hypothetical protein
MTALATPPEVDEYHYEFAEATIREQRQRAMQMPDLGLAQHMALAEGNVPHQIGTNTVVHPASWALLPFHRKPSGRILMNPEPRTEFLGSGLYVRAPLEIFARTAEEYAKSLGLYGTLVLTKGFVWAMMPSMRALYVDLVEDPDEGEYPTIRFTIMIPDPVEDVLQLDRSLQKVIYQHLPSRALMHFSFLYQFE